MDDAEKIRRLEMQLTAATQRAQEAEKDLARIAMALWGKDRDKRLTEAQDLVLDMGWCFMCREFECGEHQ